MTETLEQIAARVTSQLTGHSVRCEADAAAGAEGLLADYRCVFEALKRAREGVEPELEHANTEIAQLNAALTEAQAELEAGLKARTYIVCGGCNQGSLPNAMRVIDDATRCIDCIVRMVAVERGKVDEANAALKAMPRNIKSILEGGA